MISWIQRTFQHHFRLIFALLLIGMIIPFVFTIGSTPGIGRADHTTESREFFGHNLASSDDLNKMIDDGRLSAALQFGSNASPEQVQFYAYQRVAALHLADEMHIPAATPAEIPEFIKQLRVFAAPDGQFDVTRYDAIRNAWKTSGVPSEADVARVIADDVRAQKIEPLLAGPGYLLPGDVNAVIVKGDTSWTISTATLDYAQYDPDVHLTDAEISKYFSDNSFRYTIAPRISADYVDFPALPFLAQVAAPTAAEVREFYESNPGRFPKPASAKGPVVKPDPAGDFAAVEPQVRLALQFEKAKRSAVKAASDLAYALYDGKVSRGAPLDSFLAERKLKAASLAPFTLESGPAELGGSREIAGAAFELNADRFYSEALPSPNGAVVLVWKESLPSREPSFAEVQAKVRADAYENEKRKRFVEFGRTLKAGIERRLKSGEPFDTAVAEAAGGTKLTVKAYPSFTLRSQPHDIDPAAMATLDRLGRGSVSDMETTSANMGILVYVSDKKLPPLDDSGARYTQLRIQMARAYSRSESVAILGDIVGRELKRGDPAAK
jgi:peptidyl-prolyl cis-trans isomerase D